MAKMYIPLINTPRQSLQTTLGSQDVKLTVFYQQSDGHWYMTVESPSGSVVASSRRLLAGANVLPPYSDFVGNFTVESLRDEDAMNSAPWGDTHALAWSD